MAVNEPIINKDMLLFKLDNVERYSEKQSLVIKDFATHEQAIKENAEQIGRVRVNYLQFEKALFDEKITGTKSIVKDTNLVFK